MVRNGLLQQFIIDIHLYNGLGANTALFFMLIKPRNLQKAGRLNLFRGAVGYLNNT
jgi:hypothetical protein